MKSARDIAIALGGRWRNNHASVCCPAHEDSTPSFSISSTRDGRPLVHCFAGCSQADVIQALKARGLWEGDGVKDPSYPQGYTVKHDRHSDKDDRERQNLARDLWERADRITGTKAEDYLRSRGIRPRLSGWPDALGYLPRLAHSEAKKQFPVMLAALTTGSGELVAVQRTWLDETGHGKAPVEQAKKTLGQMGRAAVRLGTPTHTLGLAEGVETALSASQIYGIPVWATLSANRLGKVEIPQGVTALYIFADKGEVGMSCAIEAADIYERQNLTVDVLPPHVHHGDSHSDYNDVVRAGA